MIRIFNLLEMSKLNSSREILVLSNMMSLSTLGILRVPYPYCLYDRSGWSLNIGKVYVSVRKKEINFNEVLLMKNKKCSS